MCEVTIGIPVYQADDYITATIGSALSQTCSNIKILIVDDCGGDRTMEVVEQLQRSHPCGIDIRILMNQSNLGVDKSRNRIIEEAQGEFLYFLDSNDMVEPATVELLMATMSLYYAKLVFGSYEKVDNVIHSGSVKYLYPSFQVLHSDEQASYVFSHYQVSRAVLLSRIIYRYLCWHQSLTNYQDRQYNH